MDWVFDEDGAGCCRVSLRRLLIPKVQIVLELGILTIVFDMLTNAAILYINDSELNPGQ